MEGYSSKLNRFSALTEITDRKSEELLSKILHKYLTKYN